MTAASASWRLIVHEELASTQDSVLAAAEAGEAEGLAVLARRQTAGRGTQGRAWRSTSGNLHLSILLRPGGPVREWPQWSLLAGVALAETVAARVPEGAAIALKWPNDLLLGGAKCAGILTQAAPDGAGGIGWIVIGIGVNLAEAPALPDRPTASLRDAGIAPPDPVDFAGQLLGRIAHWRGMAAESGFTDMRRAWMVRGPVPGTSLRLQRPEGMIAGRYLGLAEDGRLLLDADGRTLSLASGEVMPDLPPRAGRQA